MVSAGVRAAAMRAGAYHIAVGKETLVGRRIGLPNEARLDMPGGIEVAEEFLCQQPVGDARGSREMIERQAKATIDIGLQRVLARAILGDRYPRRLGGEFTGCAVFVGPAEKQDLVPGLPAKARMDVRRQERSGKVAEMLYAVDVRQCAGDQKLGHGISPSCRVRT
jgi:hypothetical protein